MRAFNSFVAGVACATIVVIAFMGLAPSSRGDEAVAPSVRFTASGDISSSEGAAATLNQVASIEPDLHVGLGDLSYGQAGAEQAWCDFVTSKVGAAFPFELVSGNHEDDGQNGNVNDFSACLPNQLPGLIGTYGRQYYVDVPQVNPLVRFIMISPALTSRMESGRTPRAAHATNGQPTPSTTPGRMLFPGSWWECTSRVCRSADTSATPGLS
jgi:hypothetical protein